MKIGFLHRLRLGTVKMTCCALALALHNAAMGAEIPTDSVKIAAGVVKASSYETPPAKGYIVANSTNIFSDHALYGTGVTGQLKLGDKVEGMGLDPRRKGRDRHRLRANFDARSPRQIRCAIGGTTMSKDVEVTNRRVDLDKWLGVGGLVMSSLLILSLVVR
jgi:hypothetical protein